MVYCVVADWGSQFYKNTQNTLSVHNRKSNYNNGYMMESVVFCGDEAPNQRCVLQVRASIIRKLITLLAQTHHTHTHTHQLNATQRRIVFGTTAAGAY